MNPRDPDQPAKPANPEGFPKTSPDLEATVDLPQVPPVSKPTPDPGEDLDMTSVLNEPTDPASDLASESSHVLFGSPGVKPPESVGELLHLGKYALIGSPDPKSSKPYVEGGEGRVYLAQSLEGGPKVALKMPLPQYAEDPVRCARLIKEARQLKSMKHPAIVEVFDIDDEHQPPYYTMTYLPGESLAGRMRAHGQAFELDEVLRYAVPLADAARYVHDQKGVSHRDIKPHNVMINQAGDPVFVDFGLSRDNTGDTATISDHATERTQRFKVGTAMYMAPELFDGKAGNAQADIYAFGVMLYELATGQRPYDASDFTTLNKKKRLEDPRNPAGVHPAIDPRLTQVINHALARRAKDRYSTMEDLHEDLQAIQDGEQPMHAPGISGGQTLPTDTSTSQGGGVARRLLKAAVILLALGGAGVGVAVGVNQMAGDEVATTTSESEADLPLKDSTDSPLALADPEALPSDDPAALIAPVIPDPAPSDREAEVTQVQPTSQDTVPQEPEEAANAVPAEAPIEPVDTATPPPAEPTVDTPVTKPNPAPTPPDTTVPGGVLAESGIPEDLNILGGIGAGQKAAAPAESADPLITSINEITAELAKTAPRDAFVAERLGKLGDDAKGKSNNTLAAAHVQWLHSAAVLGLTDSLAVLITRADDFSSSSAATLDNGYTWLQSAVYAGGNEAFAAGFTDWMDANDIDDAIVDQAAAGTRKPADMASFLRDRSHWVDVLK